MSHCIRLCLASVTCAELLVLLTVCMCKNGCFSPNPLHCQGGYFCLKVFMCITDYHSLIESCFFIFHWLKVVFLCALQIIIHWLKVVFYVHYRLSFTDWKFFMCFTDYHYWLNYFYVHYRLSLLTESFLCAWQIIINWLKVFVVVSICCDLTMM